MSGSAAAGIAGSSTSAAAGSSGGGGSGSSSGEGLYVPLLVDAWGVPAPLSSSKRFFVIKCSRMANIYLSIHKGCWATSRCNTRKLSEAFAATNHVLLLFSANESGGFQGYARMMTPPLPHLFPGASPLRCFSDLWASLLPCLALCVYPPLLLYKDAHPGARWTLSASSQDELPPALGALLCAKMHAKPTETLLDGTVVEGHGAPIDHQTFFRQLKARGELEDEPAGQGTNPGHQGGAKQQSRHLQQESHRAMWHQQQDWQQPPQHESQHGGTLVWEMQQQQQGFSH
ncbi:zinc finger (ccch type) motif-containing protein [Cyclospora cayetanensis]|uniref:Zinc finger (Ccch type) motif-containing protein n=1 Tax=Cyclospora cayetanensis TaxID=88456 RepID=A0A1D3D8B1_9EIME|nr:zinc finger (ccch type) motif-containing protein [Cyclospora cayetanensis]